MSWRPKRLWLGGHSLHGVVKMANPYCARVAILSALPARHDEGCPADLPTRDAEVPPTVANLLGGSRSPQDWLHHPRRSKGKQDI